MLTVSISEEWPLMVDALIQHFHHVRTQLLGRLSLASFYTTADNEYRMYLIYFPYRPYISLSIENLRSLHRAKPTRGERETTMS